MSGIGASRRRMLRRYGRPVTLRRQTGVNPVAFAGAEVPGMVAGYGPDAITGAVQQGDATAAVLAEDLVAEGFPVPPRSGDSLVDGRTWKVMAAYPVYDGSDLLGWDLWIRGGAV